MQDKIPQNLHDKVAQKYNNPNPNPGANPNPDANPNPGVKL